LTVDFQESLVTSDASSLVVRELDEHFASFAYRVEIGDSDFIL